MARGRNVSINLREEIVRGAPDRVDAEAGIIYGVKILGPESPNTHGLSNVQGTRYTVDAMARARPLYEGTSVYKGHPPRDDTDQERDPDQKIGWLENVQLREGGLYADLHLLQADPFTPKLIESAQKKPDVFTMSHNARGKGVIESGMYVIHEIPRVRSVDVVCDGATVNSLFESRERKAMKKITLRKLVESRFSRGKIARTAAAKGIKKALLEMDGALPDMEMDEPVAPAEEDKDGRQCLTEAVAALLASGDEEDHALAEKVMRLLKPESASTEESEDDSDKKEDKEEGKNVEEEVGGTGSGDGGPIDKGKIKESKERLTGRCKDLCGLAGLKPEAELLESLVALPSDSHRVKLLNSMKKLGGQASNKDTTPRSSTSAPGTSLLESSGGLRFAKPGDRLTFLRGGRLPAPSTNGN